MNLPSTMNPATRAMWVLSLLLVGGLLAGLEAQTVSTNVVPGVTGGPFAGASHPLPPPEPEVRPFIADTYPEDNDGDRIADSLVAEVARLQATAATSQFDGDRIQAQNELADAVDVELIFNRRVTDEQINRFITMGGEITYLYRSVSYGWNGRIARSQITAIPQVMGDALVLVNAPVQAQLHLDKATQTGRVRVVWGPGFAGSAGGYSGDATISIAILDSGVDGSHTDLSGRQVYWRDFTPDGQVTAGDVIAHGSHVAGIALGSGSVGGVGPSTLRFTQDGNLASVEAGSFFPAPIDLPTSSVDFNMTAMWAGGGSTTLHLVSHVKGTSGGWVGFASSSGASPRTLNSSFTGDAGLAYSPALLSAGNGTVSGFVVTGQVTAYPGAGDGFNTFRGVAPGCNWAGAKVFRNDGSGSTAWINAALAACRT